MIIEQPPAAGFDIICFSSFMYAGTKESESLPVEKRIARIGEFELIPEESNIIQLGNGGAAGGFSEMKMISPNSLLYLGVYPNAKVNDHQTELLIFQQLEAGKPRQFPRDLFGIEGANIYQNFFVCVFYFNNSIAMTHRANACRFYKDFVVYAK